MSIHKYISVRGARQHNLKNINIDLPKDSLVVITGPSGSGKSSLAFETIYAEGQRRYVESLSAYARQFLDSFNKPDVDSIEGLSPAISIEQKTTSKNPRSTVGTITEIYDYLRLLYARVGIAYSPTTGLPIERQTVSQMVDSVIKNLESKRVYLLAPIVRGRKGEYKKEIGQLKKQGYQRIKIDGTVYDIEESPSLDKNSKHDISVVVDRIAVKADSNRRLAESFETALRLSEGIALVEDVDTGQTMTFSEKFACPVSGFTIEDIEPRLFSFNNPFGSCPTCHGLGEERYFSEELLVPNPKEPLVTAIIPLTADYYSAMIEGLAKHYKIDPKTPYNKLPKDFLHVLMDGTGDVAVKTHFQMGETSVVRNKPFEGVMPMLERRYRDTESESARTELEKYQATKPCDACKGTRLNEKALAVKIDERNIAQISKLSITDAYQWIDGLKHKLSQKHQVIGERLLKEIRDRLGFLNNVGIGYLSLSRMAGTLSGGESQRIRLASQIGSGLTGVLYVLDEPSIGLHQRDNDKLIETLKRLRDLGNTVLVVEHDEDAMRASDYIIDMGPGAGRLGGNITAEGTMEQILNNPESLTGQYLSGAKSIEVPKKRRKGNGKSLELIGAKGNNLQNVRCKIPLGTLTCVTGVSGSGKSTLINQTLFKVVAKELNKSKIETAPYDKITGLEHIDSVIDIDQSAIGRTPRSNPATYTKIFDHIRDFYAELPESKARGYQTGRFSFNVKGGRCEACSGDGLIKIEMHFLPDVFVVCDECHGKRYNRETLDIKLHGKSIADVLDMTIDEAVEFFNNITRIREKLLTLQEVGLGYMHVGQQATTLSGGEAQRIKLARELSKRATGKTLYILDEPTTGLHFDDIKKLIGVMQQLVEQGNTVVVIEHNLDVIKTADYIIDMGPEGGTGGGHVVATGTPEEVAENNKSYTGQYLKRYV